GAGSGWGWAVGAWEGGLGGMEWGWPRTIAASGPESLRGGSGSRALPPTMPGRSAAKETSSSGLRAIARRQPVTARLNGSVGLSLTVLLPLMLDDMRRRISSWQQWPQLNATFTDDSGNSVPKQR